MSLTQYLLVRCLLTAARGDDWQVPACLGIQWRLERPPQSLSVQTSGPHAYLINQGRRAIDG